MCRSPWNVYSITELQNHRNICTRLLDVGRDPRLCPDARQMLAEVNAEIARRVLRSSPSLRVVLFAFLGLAGGIVALAYAVYQIWRLM